jgi:carbon monoxide dehydrogenase subunit G
VDFENTFRVKAPIDEVYATLLDLERVAPAMPGAKVLEKVGDDAYKVAIKVKLGPVSMTYRGEVTIVDKDPASHTATLDVKAKEARGQGTATAKVVLSLVEEGDETVGMMKANVQLAGKAAAMGRGVIEDVSRQLVQTFATNLEGMLASSDAGAEEGAAAEAPPAPAQEPPPADTGDGSPKQPPSKPEEPPKKPAAAAPAGDEGLPVLPLVAGMVADRMRDPKVLAAVLGGAIALGYLLGRRAG